VFVRSERKEDGVEANWPESEEARGERAESTALSDLPQLR
jgi:hypothetical protein